MRIEKRNIYDHLEAAHTSLSYERALRFVLHAEGGINASAADSGNRGGNVTNHGVTQAVYNDWRREKGLPYRSTREITLNEVKELYYEDFWLASGSNLLPYPLDVIHFDAAVNKGPRRAILLLQRSLGVKEDGLIGNKTKSAYLKAEKTQLTKKYLHVRAKYYKDISAKNQNQIFLRGWLNRLTALEKFIRTAS